MDQQTTSEIPWEDMLLPASRCARCGAAPSLRFPADAADQYKGLSDDEPLIAIACWTPSCGGAEIVITAGDIRAAAPAPPPTGLRLVR